jgi:hypothetical protein
MFIIPRRTIGIFAGLATAGLVALLGIVTNDREIAAPSRPLVKTACALIADPQNRRGAAHTVWTFVASASGYLGRGGIVCVPVTFQLESGSDPA